MGNFASVVGFDPFDGFRGVEGQIDPVKKGLIWTKFLNYHVSGKKFVTTRILN